MKYFIIAITLSFMLTACDPSKLIGIGDERKEDVKDKDDHNTGEEIELTEIPQVILDFVESNYPDKTIIKAEFENGLYAIYLSDGSTLIFNRDGEIEDINGPRPNEDKD